MHYIRFLKPPRAIQHTGGLIYLTAVLTITTDLGESFLTSDTWLIVELEDNEGNKLTDGGKGKEYLWKGSDGYKGLSVEIPVGIKTLRAGTEVKLCVSARQENVKAGSWESVLGDRELIKGERARINDRGGVVGVKGRSVGNGMCERVFSSRDGGPDIHIWEETGESIARHIWDAGLVLSAYLTSTCSWSPSSPTYPLPELPILRIALSQPELNVLELGAGCGIVGITLSQLLPHISHVMLTDLPEALEVLTQNLSVLPSSSTYAIPTHSVLDWSQPLPPPISSTSWDLILIADCTYNPDVVPDLVRTLGRVAEGNAEVTVLLAMKVRHASEIVFFSLMKDAGWGIRESGKVDLPVLSGEGEEIEIFIFGRMR